MTLDDLLERTVLSPDGCMLWTGATSGDPEPGKTGRGYPRVWFHGANVGAHRLSFVLSGRRLLYDDDQVDHCCPTFPPNRLCIRPDHLERSTHKRNCHLRDYRRRKNDRGLRAIQKQDTSPDADAALLREHQTKKMEPW